MSELQFLKIIKSDIEAKIAEIESNKAPVKWEPKGGYVSIYSDGLIQRNSVQSDGRRSFGSLRENEEQAEHAAEWMRKFNRLMCWFEENAPGHEMSIVLDYDTASIGFSASQHVIGDLRTKIRDGVVEL